MTDQEIEDIVTGAKTIAVVGLSPKADRPSFRVASYLQSKGYRIIPVRPGVEEILGEKAYPSLSHIPSDVEIDVVDIFRKSEDVPPVVEEAIKTNAKTVWMQEGIINEEAAQKAEAAGLRVVMDRCMLKEHRRFTG
ncbi:MAG: CoA-binding protein [Proteobacteria bacterium]|nr:CoA-binding protein [Pseudomonadota bacterium]